MGKQRDVESEALALIRRALELQDSYDASSDRGLPENELADIAYSLDVSPQAFAAALAESKVGARRSPSRLARLVDKLIGPAELAVERPSSASADEMRERTFEWLSVTHGLKPRITVDEVVVAERRRDAIGVVSTTVRRAQGLGGLSAADEVKVAVVDVVGVINSIDPAEVSPAGSAMAADASEGAAVFLAQIRAKRSDAIGLGSAIGVSGVAAASVLAVLTNPLVWVSVPGVLAVGVFASRVSHKETVKRVSSSLEAAADGIVRGDAAPRPIGVRRASR